MSNVVEETDTPDGCYLKIEFREGEFEKRVRQMEGVMEEHGVVGKPKDWGKEVADGQTFIWAGWETDKRVPGEILSKFLDENLISSYLQLVV
jgi:hypothetical protein